MTDVKEVLKECEAFLEGHFLLSSGRHSSAYCQMAYLQQYPDKCAMVMQNVAEQLKDLDVDVIVGPAMGGVCIPALLWPLCCFCRSFWRAVCRCGAVRCT